MKDVQGKRLLIVSSDANDLEIVNAAREMGVYVVCCDRYENWDVSPAKKAADAAWNVDYTDIETVKALCEKEKIDGVLAGYGEDRVYAACKISNAIGTPFYATEEQIDITRNKRLFKETCARYGVRVPKEYCFSLPMSAEDMAAIEYPVIVKPSDNGGRKGITICYDEAQLKEAIELAIAFSKDGNIVVEEYLSGIEMSSVYTMKDGEISLSCVNDKYSAGSEGYQAALCGFVVTPSRFYEQYVREIDPGIKHMLRSIGAKNGMAYFQHIATPKGIVPFEMGYRINGNNDFKVIRKYNGIDYMKMLISHSVSGDMGDSLEKDNPLFGEYACTYVVQLNAGKISKVDYSGIEKRENIDDIFIWKNAGDTVIESSTNTHKCGMIKFHAQTVEEIYETVNAIHEKVLILDENGDSMLMNRFEGDWLRS